MKTCVLGYYGFLQLKMAWGELGGDIGGKGKKLINLTTKFGRLDHIRSDLFKVLSEKQHTLDLNHPVITDAVQKGQTLFIITSVYKAEKCEVTVSDLAWNGKASNTIPHACTYWCTHSNGKLAWLVYQRWDIGVPL